MFRRFSLSTLLILCAGYVHAAEEAPLPPGDGKPVLQLEAGGPTAAVTAMLFSKDGKTLYAAGLDKVVRVWEQVDNGWTLKRSFRVPIGPGVAGAINALALSPDGRWLAVGGRSFMRGESEFRRPGLVVPTEALSETMWRDGGTIHLFDVRNPAGGKVLRGHQGEVRALAFAPEQAGKPPLLVSAAIERGQGKPFGSVRLWDVAQGGDALALIEKLPARPEGPGLAVWHTGQGKKEVRVAIAWPETEVNAEQGRLRLWDPAAGAGKTLQTWDCGSWNSTAALLGLAENEARVAAGSVDKFGDKNATGGLRVWRFSKDADTKAQYERQVPFVFERLPYRPLALTPVSSRADGRLDLVAAVLQPGKENLDNVLTLTDLTANPATVRLRFALANTDPIHAPVVAASPRGRWLAVAGFKDRAIEMYRIDDLLLSKKKPAARLHSKGILYSKAVFVHRGKEAGLWLSEDANAKSLQGGVFFSFDKRALTDDAKGWSDDTPGRAGWSVAFKEGVGSVSQGGQAYPKIELQAGQQPTWYALRPSTAQHKQALLAVAHTNRASAETYITLFDVATGRPLRQFTGHLQDVRWLAFSEMHPLLVSASEDQTVSVWSFADLDAGVGMIQGVVLGERAGKVVVRAVAANSAAAKAGLKRGEVVEGLVDAEGKVQEAKSAVDFYWAVNLKKPGEVVQVKTAGRPALRIVLGQGVEERKPLLSLFVTRDRGEWIGWTPGGPFDRSSDNADNYLGWHVNTGKPEQPVTFAAAREYQGEFYKKNILKYLVEEGSLSEALKAQQKADEPPPPDPELSAGIVGAERDQEHAELFRGRQKKAWLMVALNQGYPLDAKDTLVWQATTPDGKRIEPRPMQRVEERSWEADLSELPWKQGEFRLEILFRSEKHNKQTSQTLTLRYQPLKPRISAVVEKQDVKADADPVAVLVMEPKIVLAVNVKPEPGQTAAVRFVQAGAKDALKPRTVAQEETFRQEFTLQEGVNHLEIVAVNKDALQGFEVNETSVLRVDVQYKKPEKQPPPRITALRVAPWKDERFRGADGKEVLVVEKPSIEVASEIAAENPLTLAEWSVGDENAVSLLESPAPKKLTVSRKLDLKAGAMTTLRLRAATERSEPAETTLRVVYRPLPPRISIAQPARDVFKNEVKIEGLLSVQAPSEKYQFTVRVKDATGREVSNAKIESAEKNGTWTCVAPLAPGENVIEATVQNDWRRAVTERVSVTYRRPPILEAVAPIQVGDKPFVDLSAKIWSPGDVKLLGALLNATEARAVAFKETEEMKDGLKGWNVTIKDVPVKAGEKWLEKLVLNVRNADGLSRNPITIAIKPPLKPAPRPPVVRWQVPEQDTTQQAKYKVPFVVQSESPLKSVELRRGDELVYQADLRKVTKSGKQFELSDAPEITLEWEANRLRLVAVNDGGQAATPAAIVTVPRPPVRVLIDKIDVLAPTGEVLKSFEPSDQTMEQVRFPQLPRGFLFLKGHVEWADARAEQLDEALLNVVAYVNDSRQFPVALEPRGAGKESYKRSFKVPMALTKKEGNNIVIELPRMKQEANSRREFKLDCAEANKNQRLHVLIVGVNVTEGEQLKNNVIASFFGSEAPRGFEGEFKSDAFQPARLAAVLYDNVQKEAVFGQLGEIEKQIRVLKEQTGWQNDIVLIYYQGGEGRDANNKRYLKTSLNERFANLPLDKTAIAYDDLPRLPGVQLMVLNVSPTTVQGKAAADEPFKVGSRNTAVMHFVWKDLKEVNKPGPVSLSLVKDARLASTTKIILDIATRATNAVKQNVLANKDESISLIPADIGDRQLSSPR